LLGGRRPTVNQDFVDLLRAFADLKVEAIVVGAHALAADCHVRATKDLDVWIPRSGIAATVRGRSSKT
jgi:hypothetical protein